MGMFGFAAIVAVSFIAMEPFTAATHRFVMHGLGEWLHRSHHRATPNDGWERNDWYPVLFASVVMLGMWAGFQRDSLLWLVPAGVGVTLYGACYAIVHDGYIHRRLGLFGARRIALLDRLADAHRIHHLYNGAPFGMLAPVVPTALRARAAGTERDPFTRRVGVT